MMDREAATRQYHMPESVAVIPAVAESGRAQARPAIGNRDQRPSAKLLVGLMALIIALTVCGSSWAYLKGAQILKSYQEMTSRAPGVAGHREVEFLARVGRWQLAMTLVMAGGGGILILIAASAFQSRQRVWAKRLAESEAEWKARTDKVTAQLSDQSQAVAEESRCQLEKVRTDQEKEQAKLQKEQAKLHSEISELSRANALLNEELEQRRRAEKSLAQQRQDLARSKDVLELHVQARTQELQKLQRRSELILNSAAEGICGFDLHGKITFANPAAARVMGLGVPELIGQPEDKLFPAFRAETKSDTASANGHQPVEVVSPRPNGSTFAAEYLRSPIHENGRVVGEVLMFKDITERKQAAETLDQRMAELARSNAELEQFAFVASHDLQEPLRKIQAFGDRLKAKCEEAKLEAGRDYLERMQSAAARMQTLINDLLTFSRVLSRTQPFEPVNLTMIAREVLGDLEVRIEKSNAKVEVGELPTVEGDPMQIRQLLQNLIGNALKFHRPGAIPQVRIQGRICVQPSGRGKTVFVNRKSDQDKEVALGEEFCELTVQDNGIGFDEKYLDKIFAVFTRLHGRQEYEGTGIGLAVCRRITDRHGGTIAAHGKPGEGATFIVHLPLKQSPQPVCSP